MELEEMKKSWSALSAQLEKSEGANRDAIKSLLSDKVVSSYEQICKNEKNVLISCAVLCVAFPVFLAAGLFQHWYSMVFIEVLPLIGVCLGLYNLRTLKTANIENGVVSAQRSLAEYQKGQAYSHTTVGIISVLWLVGFFLLEGKFLTNNIWILLAVTLAVACVIEVIQAKQLKSKLTAINKNLEELRKFEAE